MRVGSAGSGAVGLVPFGTGRAAQADRDDVEPVARGVGAQPDVTAAFATRRHPYVRAEPVGQAWRGEATASQSVGGDSTRPRGAFLAQFIAQERLGQGLTLDRAADGVRAYRRAEIPLVEIRAGATVDVAA